MQNIKYHIATTAAVILFSYSLASAVNQFIRFSFAPAYTYTAKSNKISTEGKTQKTFEDYQTILNTNFFHIGDENGGSTDAEGGAYQAASDLKDLTLLGTISGPASIARALIKKSTEKESQIFKLWNDVYGYKLVRIDNSKTYLKKGEKIEILDMYAKEKEQEAQSNVTAENTGEPVQQNQNISRSEIQQNVLNNIDNALKGLRAGPFRVDGKITGYKIFRVTSDNILYKLGARTGDVIKRVNGHPIDSTEKLMGLWQSVQGESKISVDLERGGRLQSYNLNITD